MKFLFLILFILPSINHSQTTDYVNTELKKVQTHIQEQNYAQGLSILNTLLQRNPNDNNIYRHYAELLLDLKHYDLALTNINKALLLSQNNPSNHLIAGNIYRAQKRYTEAQNAYNTTIKLNPGMGEAYTEFTLLNLQHYLMRDAQRLAELAYRFNPGAWQNIVLKAKIAQQTGNKKLAQKIFLDGIQDLPYNPHLLDAFAEFYISIGEDSKAIVILKEANTRFGESIARNLLLGDKTFMLNQQEDAIAYYQKINDTYQELKLPVSPLVQWRLYNLYRQNNKVEDSYIYLQKALEHDPLNQLYISIFYQYLLSTDNEPLKKSLVKHLENIAQEERKSGINDYYLSLLQKIVTLDPSNNNARKQLAYYAKIKGRETQIQNLLTQSLSHDSDNKLLKNTINLRNHLSKTQRLDMNAQNIYQYTNKIFVQDNICYFAKGVQQDLKDLEVFYPKIFSQVELQQNFAQESRTMFQTNTNYNTVSHLYVNNQNSTINVDIFDKNGLPLTTFKHGFQTGQLSKILIDYTQFLSELLPSIGYISGRKPNSHFTITLGSDNGLTTNSQVAIMDKDFTPLTTASVTLLSPKSATIKQLSVPLHAIDIESAYIVPLEFVPVLNTNTNTVNTRTTNTNTTITNTIIKDINQLIQKRYPMEINFSF